MDHDHHDADRDAPAPDAAPVMLREDDIFARYDAALDMRELAESRRRELLLVLYRIMQGFVDLGFSIKAGDKFTTGSEIGLDDVLRSLIPDIVPQQNTTEDVIANEE